MTKIRCLTLGNQEFHSYRGKSGKNYNFNRCSFTKVESDIDAFTFLNAGPEDAPLFESEEKGAKKKLIDKLFKKKAEPEEVPNAAPAGPPDIKPTIPDEPIEVPDEPKEEPMKELSYAELKALNKNEQVDMIHKIYGKDKRAPKFEGDKIRLIQESYKSKEE